MKMIWTVARRELRGLFDQPTGYILLVVFVTINNFLYFRQAYLYGTASLRPMFDLLPWLLLFFIPAVTMRSLAEDKRSGTIEIVLAQPITEVTYLLGKFIGQALFVWTGLALTLVVPIGLSLGADLHVGVVIAQYFGAALLAAGLAAVGVWASSLTKNQITAFIIGVVVMFMLVLVGLDPLLVGLPPALSLIAARLGVLSHFQDIGRGVIDLRDLVYFTTLAAVFLSLAYYGLMSRKLSHRGGNLQRLRLGVTVLVAMMVVINLFGRQIGGRLDLTPGNAYTLSNATKDLVRNADDIITFRLFASAELPSQVALLRRDIDDLLRDYRNAAEGNVRIQIVDPSEDEETESQARSLGIPPVDFNVLGQSEVSIKRGFLGLAVQYADQSEVIPLIQRTDDLEYRLSSFIRSMTDSTRTTVGFLVEPSLAQSGYGGFSILRDQLSQGYEVRSLTLTTDTIIPRDVEVAILIGAPDSLTTDQRAQFADFFRRGGSAFVANDGMQMTDQQFLVGSSVVWNDVLTPFGVSVRQDVVYDLASHEQVQLQTQYGMAVLQGYPFWPRVYSTQANTVNQNIESIFLLWPSTVDTSGVEPGALTPLFVTTAQAGTEANAVMMRPGRTFPRTGLGEHVVAVAVNPHAVDQNASVAGRVVVVGNTRFLSDDLIRSGPTNLGFGLNAIDWLAQDEALIAIRAKNRTPPSLTFEGEGTAAFVKYLNVIGIPILIVIGAAIRLVGRRQRTRRKYQPLVAGGAA